MFEGDEGLFVETEMIVMQRLDLDSNNENLYEEVDYEVEAKILCRNSI